MKPNIHRHDKHTLEVFGLKCGNYYGPEQQKCNGTIMVKDNRKRNQWRYELYCDTCHTCEPNGWAKQSQLINAARDYFKATQI